MYVAASQGEIETLAELIAAGADVNVQNEVLFNI